MPGINVFPGSPSSSNSPSSSHPVTQNGRTRPQGSISIAELKDKAKESVQKEARRASAITLLRTAGAQSAIARTSEESGDLRGALSAITKAASLARMLMESSEFKAEEKSGAHGVLHKQFREFIAHDGGDIVARSDALERKLREIEDSSINSEMSQLDNQPVKVGTSIADRMRSLQDAGLTVGTAKRFSTPTMSTPPMTPVPSRPDRHSLPRVTPPPPNNALNMAIGVPRPTPQPPQHALVPPSSLGPPSPSSSPPSSPRLNHLTISEFSQAFPSIDELDELHNLVQPSNGLTSDLPNGPIKLSPPIFPVPSVDLERPSSTPVPPTITGFMTRPSSPVISKSSSLGPNRSPVMPTPTPAKLDSPRASAVSPRHLHEFMSSGLKVLLLDVRVRAEFDKEHIKADAVVCLEPSVLLREGINHLSLESSLAVAPTNERSMFLNRDKFELVAFYDQSSQTLGASNSPLASLYRAIYETAYQKTLKNMPLLIAGGLDAWKKEFENEVIHGTPTLPSLDISLLTPQQNTSPAISGSPNPNNPFLSMDGRKLWESSSRPESGTSGALFDPSRTIEPRPLYNGSPRLTWSGPDKVHLNGVDLSRKPLARPSPIPLSAPGLRSFPDNIPNMSPVISNGSPISYPQFSRPPQSASTSSFTSSSLVSPPPQASINPSLSRRRTDYIDQSQEALSGLHSARPSIDYPDLNATVLRRPPAAASSALERQDNRPRLNHALSSASLSEPVPPRIQSDYPVPYWGDTELMTSGLKNMGNTCYMNAPIQCLNATVPFARFFLEGRWKAAVNHTNPLGTKGNITQSFARLVSEMWREGMSITPFEFRKTICAHEERFRGSDQHDSQEFLSFLLDGVHEDLNRVLNKAPWVKTPEREAELERLSQQIASEQEWRMWKMRNDSIVVDFFQGQFRNRLECMTCHKTSTTYDPFTSLPLPVPSGRGVKADLRQCLDAFVKTEVMEKHDAWRCPNCKELRKTTKTLSLSRLPPILIIHLKRFSFEGRWTDKIDTFVDFPMKSLDLTNYVPPPLPPGALNGPHLLSSDDPRAQLPPYRYDLYAVTNHFGSLSSGHYTAFVSSRTGWSYCDDSSIKPADAKDVVNKQAYILFYKRTRT